MRTSLMIRRIRTEGCSTVNLVPEMLYTAETVDISVVYSVRVHLHLLYHHYVRNVIRGA